MLAHLALRDFRNVERASWRPGPGAQLLLGGNGAGKTSLLEAVYLLATTRSFRTSQLADCCRAGESAFHLSGELGLRARRVELGWSAGGARHRAVDGVELPLGEHLAVQPVLAWTSAEGALLSGPPATRRRFLDRALVSWRPAALGVLGRYQRALAGKRALLARGERRGLEAWNDLLAREGAEVAARRAELVAALALRLAPLAGEVGLLLPEVGLVYEPSPPDAPEGAAPLRAALERAAREEVARRQPLVGPHRDEIAIRLGGRPARRGASAGERKALGLLLLAAQARLLEEGGAAPLLLLDDLDTELDGERLAALWRALDGAPQLLATSNRPEVWRSLPVAERWRVEGGTVALAGASGGSQTPPAVRM
ncbi:MAG TPA: DNA replication and repair protein RecF [Thermoanaerobaculia bacterium]|nr:DNA replication and repair protein RecF [Thermoanaerobaculia bacterium]